MTARFPVNKLLILVALIILYCFNIARGQAPKITYPTPPASYPVNSTITPLVPKNSGGNVPTTPYGNVTTFATGFLSPREVVVDKSGNLYVSDQSAGAIKKITPTGVVSVFVGNGSPGFSGAEGLAIDNTGNIYFADVNGHRIGKISPAAVVTTVAGTGIPGWNDGAAITAQFQSPMGIAVDVAGVIYVADGGNHVIRKIAIDGTVSTLAGNPNNITPQDGKGSSAGFNIPYSIVINKDGNLYVTDELDNTIRSVAMDGTVATIAGNTAGGANDGIGISASFHLPEQISVDGNGNMYVADAMNSTIRMVTTGGIVTTIAGVPQQFGLKNGAASTSLFWAPVGLIIGLDNSLYIADDNNRVIRRLTLSGYTIDNPLPVGLTFDPTTGIITGTPTTKSPATPYTVTAYNASGGSSTTVTIAVGNSASVNLPLPPKFTYPTPNHYTVNTLITTIGPTTLGGQVPATIFGNVSTLAGQDRLAGYKDDTGNAALFSNLWGIDIDASDNLYVADGPYIRKITPGALVTTLAGGNPNGVSDGTGTLAGFGQAAGLAVTPSGNVVVGDISNKSLRQVTTGGAVTTIGGSGINNFNPAGVASAASGDIYVADQSNDIIRDFTSGGTNTIYAGSQGVIGSTNGNVSLSTYNNPADLKFDQAGNLFIADENNNMIREASASGTVTTVAGKNNPGLQDGPIATALFSKPLALTLDAVNNIYVSDAHGLVIRMIDARGVVVSVAGNNANSVSRDGIGPEASFAKVSGMVYKNGVIFATDRTCVRQIIVTGYSIDKQLPNGLAFDSATGEISGTPTVVSPSTDYTITGYNTGGSYSFIVNITVDPPPPPVITYPTPEVYPRNTAIPPLIPTNTGGTATATSTSSAYTVDKSLPPGLTLDPTTGIISGTPTTISQTADYTITAHNDGGAGSYTINITVFAPKLPQAVITFNRLPVKTYGDADFDPGATSNDNLVPISYSSDNTAIATIVNGQIHITAAGTANITATQPGDMNYDAAFPAIQPLTVKPALLTIAVDNYSRYVGQPNPTFIPHYSGFVNGENQANLTTQPIITTTAIAASAPGVYPIEITGATSNNYDIHVTGGTLTVIAVPPTVVVPNAFTPNGDGINDLWNIKSIEAYPKCIVSVYSRYGTLIYQSKGYPRSWDGTSNGTPVPTGTYYYIINLNEDNNKPLTGYVAVIR